VSQRGSGKLNRITLEIIMSSRFLTSASLDGLSLSERAFQLAGLVHGCGWVADALEKSMSTHFVCEDEDVNARVEAVAGLMAVLLHLASECLYDLHGDLDNEKLMRPLEQSLNAKENHHD
jgi:hypothetical protein